MLDFIQKQKINLFATAFCLLGVSLISAQNEPVSLTLEKARQTASTQNYDVASKEKQVLIAEKNTELSQQKRLPEVFADFNLQRNLIIPVTPVPAKMFDPNAKDGEMTAMKFSTNWTANTGINASYDLFNPLLKSEIRQKKMEVEIAKTDRIISENELRFNVGNAYASALIAQEQLRLSTADVAAKTTVLKMLEQQYSAGKITLIELNQGKSDLNSALANQSEAQNIVEKSNAQLLYQLGQNPENGSIITFEEDLETLFKTLNSPQNESSESLSLKKLEQQKSLLEEQINSERYRYYPTVTLGGYFGGNFFDNNLNIFKDQYWHGNSYLKAGVKIPITDWFSYKQNQTILKYQREENELAYRDQQNKRSLSMIEARKDAESAAEKYRKMKENFQLQQKNRELIMQQYQEGKLLIKSIAEADLALQQAKNAYLNAAYDYITAELKLENERSK